MLWAPAALAGALPIARELPLLLLLLLLGLLRPARLPERGYSS